MFFLLEPTDQTSTKSSTHQNPMRLHIFVCGCMKIQVKSWAPHWSDTSSELQTESRSPHLQVTIRLYPPLKVIVCLEHETFPAGHGTMGKDSPKLPSL